MNKPSIFSSRSFRKGSLSLIFTAIVIVVVILANVLFTALSEKHPFTFDLTANKDYTIGLSDEYESFVKDIDLDVTVTMCAAEGDFNGSTFANQMVTGLLLTDYMNGSASETTVKYGRQVGMFLKSFPELNSHITLQFANPSSVTEFSGISGKYTNDNLTYGDIIISCNHPSADKQGTFERYQVLHMNEIFTVEANQEYYYNGYSYYNEITGSSLASGMVSALYIVTSESSVKVAVLGGHDVSSDLNTQLETFLKKNNYEFQTVDNLLTKTIPDDCAFAVLAAPTSDYTAKELNAIDAFLKNDGKYGKTLVYLPSCSQPVLPNLEEFLAEWGIQMLPAISYDETENNYYQTPVMIFAKAGETDYTADFDEQNSFFYPMNYRLAKTTFTESNGYTVQSILTTADTAVGYPLDLTEEEANQWNAGKAKYKGKFDLMTLSTYQALNTAQSVAGESHLLMISGDFFVLNDVLSSDACYNSTLLLKVFNGLSGQEDGKSVSIEDKTISTKNFAEDLMNKSTGTVMMVLFVGIIPAALIGLSIWIWLKRKRK